MQAPADEERTSESGRKFINKQWIAAGIFLLAALYVFSVVPIIEIAWVSGVLLFTIYLFAFEVVGVDVAAAATVMVLPGLTSLLAPIMGLGQGLVNKKNLLIGFHQMPLSPSLP